jgi:hypothetical protein
MVVIDQALFGYSNGHHLIATSLQLSNPSQRILEPLSDLSGSEVQSGFAEYYTGCPLTQDNCYALSKTWYAPEMERPGCVWTHTLLVKFGDLAYLPKLKPIWELFLRPSNLDGYNTNEYSKAIHLDATTTNFSDESNNLSELKLAYLLKVILESTDPIFITAKDTNEFNKEICFLWSRLASSYCRDFSFCTGSLSNRTIEKKPLDLQIVPIRLLKSISRPVKNAQIFADDNIIDQYPPWLSTIMQELLCKIDHGFKKFVFATSEKYFNRQHAKSFALLFSMLTDRNEIDWISVFNKIPELFSSDDCIYIKNRILTMALTDELPANLDPIVVLQQLSTNSNNNYDDIEDQTLEYSIKYLWEDKPTILKTVFLFLTCHDLNDLGRRIITVLSFQIQPQQLTQLTDSQLTGSHILIRINPRLALCKELWMQTNDFQIDILNCLYNTDESLVPNILSEILTTSRENLSDQLYNVFGDASIESYLVWSEMTGDKDAILKWSRLCKFNIFVCIRYLPHVKNIYLLECIIKSLNPYSVTVSSTNKDLWIDIYYRFYHGKINQHPDIFAKFVLPLIIGSNDRYPEDIAYFAFNEVHKILANNLMDHEEWSKLSNLLPTVWFNNEWDKCRRLRKAAKKLKYRFNFYDI